MKKITTLILSLFIGQFTFAQLTLLKDIKAGSGWGLEFYSAAGIELNGSYLFVADNGSSGLELWKTDGTEMGTALLKDINVGSGGSDIKKLTQVGNTVFFIANDGMGPNLWKTNGTTAGTVMVEDNNLTNGPVNYNDNLKFTNLGSKLIYTFSDANGTEPWVSDGTAAGTFMLKDIHPTINSNPSCFATLNGEVYFPARENDNATLWKTDGTTAGTVKIKDFGSLFNSAGIDSLYTFNGRLYFFASDETNPIGLELWASDGTTAGTVLVKDINVGFYGSLPYNFRPIGNELFFIASDGFNVSNTELWKTDGTTAGTVKVKEINPTASAFLSDFTAFKGKVLFTANDGTNGKEVFITDGTTAGTQMIKNINPTGWGYSGGLMVCGDHAYFMADDGTNGQELWRTDGTLAGTVMIQNLNPTFNQGVVKILGSGLGKIFVAGNNNVNGLETFFYNCTVTLPVTLLKFDAYPQKNKALLQWLTADEENNKGFAVEHSVNGIDFKAIGWHNPSKNHAYTYIHSTPNEGINYYRIVQQDFDGKKTNSPIKSVKMEGIQQVIFKNCILDNYIEIEGEGITDKTFFTLYNTQGQLIKSGFLAQNQINTEGVESGIYIVQLKMGEAFFTYKFYR
jgi:trimeric autotransporter adhesin